MPPERLTCVVRLAGAAPRPASTFALEKRPSSGRGRFSVSADCGAGIRLGVSRTLVMPALGAAIRDLRATEVEIVDGRAKPGHDNCLRPTPTLVMPAPGIHDLLIDRLVVGQFESRSPP